MTQEQREKLVFAAGRLAGIVWMVGMDRHLSLSEALSSVQEDIESLLEEDAKDEND